MEDLEWDLALGQDSSATVASVDKRKRKFGDVLADLWDFDGMSSLWDVANVTSSGRVFQPPHLQARSSSNPPAQRPNFPAAQRNVPIDPSGVPKEDVIQKQLKRIPAAVSIWGLISSSKEHREKLSSALARLKDLVPSNLAVKAYDSTRRMVEGTLMLKLDAEGFEMDVEFHVVNIPTTFNLLLGRSWLHRAYIMVVP
ncbi:hypothetical protein RHMOL_Rhmol11G0060200 [Rhododendron molle]|uniref:Uncharacterized protein n=1 Tax=Rhododendron molle TaxID=49168 RepID=A0ACC0LPC0_RHOML|nr:hypothetical protein RHMOL_Rhmol11G0060200 [Rhododendron molle]